MTPAAPVTHAFAPTGRLAVLAALAGLPLLLPDLAWLALGLDIFLVAVVAVDLLCSRRRVEVARKLPPVFALGTANPVRLEVRSPGSPVTLAFRDDLPGQIERVVPEPVLTVGGEEWQEIEYRVRPLRRGQYAVGPLHVRYRSLLGLWRVRHTFPDTAPAKVYPNLHEMRRWELALRHGRTLEGQRRTRQRGQGTEFESLREYQPGDQFRAINWHATARSGQLMTTLYQVDRSQPIMLLIDCGRQMLPRAAGLTRLDHALNAALLLATVAAERGDASGLMLFGGEIKGFMPPRKGRGQALAMMEAIYDLEPEHVEPDYRRMLAWFRTKHKKRSLVVLFTDLTDPESSLGLAEHLVALAHQNLVMLVCLTDPDLLRLAGEAPSDRQALYRQAAALEVLAQREETKARLAAAGVLVVDLPPAEFSAAVVNRYLLIKEQGRL